jgi:hypothetical protein
LRVSIDCRRCWKALVMLLARREARRKWVIIVAAATLRRIYSALRNVRVLDWMTLRNKLWPPVYASSSPGIHNIAVQPQYMRNVGHGDYQWLHAVACLVDSASVTWNTGGMLDMLAIPTDAARMQSVQYDPGTVDRFRIQRGSFERSDSVSANMQSNPNKWRMQIRQRLLTGQYRVARLSSRYCLRVIHMRTQACMCTM